MTNLDILFWLLVALLASVAFAIESGAATRHRKVVLSTLFSVLGSILYMMFLVDDVTSLTFEPHKEQKKQSGGAAKKKAGPAAGADGEKDPPSPTGDDALDSVFSDCDVCPSMVKVARGQVLLGSDPWSPAHEPSEGPRVMVSFARSFAVGRFEITREQFGYFVAETGYSPQAGCVISGRLNAKASWTAPGYEQGGQHPVVCVGEDDVVAYLAWLSAKTERNYRLLSESEWEYIARGGAATAYLTGDTTQGVPGNFGRKRDGTTPVGFSGFNGFGVYEVHGNAAERVAGCWSDTLEPLPRDGKPHLTAQIWCRGGIVRGGGWSSPAAQVRLPARTLLADPAIGYNWVGFRVARELISAADKAQAAAGKPAAETEEVQQPVE